MNRPANPDKPQIPRWGPPLLWAAGILIVHFAAPWGLSLLSARHGWRGGGPGPWNLAALLLVAAGTTGLVYCLSLHFVQSPGAVLMERVPAYLLARGPYRFTRNPMYLSVFALWLGWTLFYASLAVLIGYLVFWAFLIFYIVPGEERDLEARFGEDYLRYKRAVPRWIGRPSK